MWREDLRSGMKHLARLSLSSKTQLKIILTFLKDALGTIPKPDA
jgi:hypothetical protein